jgi:PAS domain S-box-containing protein
MRTSIRKKVKITLEENMWKVVNRLSLNLTLFGALAVTLPIFLIMVLMGNEATKVLQQKTQEHFALQALSMQYSVLDWYQKISNLINTLRIQPNIINMQSEQHQAILKNTQQFYPDVYVMYVSNLDGQNIARSDEKPLKNFGDRQYFKDVLSGKDIATQVIISRTVSKPAIFFAAPIKDTFNKMVGVLGVGSELKILNDRVFDIKIGKTGFAFVIDQKGKLLIHPYQELSKEIKDFSYHPAVSSLLQGKTGMFSFYDEKNIEWLAYRLLLPNGWGVIVQQQKQEALQEITVFWYFVIALIVILLILLAIFTWITGNHLVRPISELTQAAISLSNGEHHKMAAIHRNDEIGFLANTFNQMAKKLQYSFDAIEEQRNHLKQILEGMPSGVCVFDKLGNLVFSNQKAHQLIGQQIISGIPLEKVSETYHFYVTGTEQLYPKEKLSIIQTLKTKVVNVIDDIEVRYLDKTIPLEAWGTPIFDENGQILYAMTAFQDITTRKQAEADHIRFIQEQEAKNSALKYSQEIQAKNADLIRLNHEKNEFLGIVSHDLKNPLSGIRGLAEIIRESSSRLSTQDISEYSQMIFEESERMFQLITNLLDVNAIEAEKFNIYLERINIIEILQKLIRNYADRAEIKELQLHFEYSDQNLFVQSDRIITEQILDNLISNAIKYSPIGKHIFIRITKQEQQICCEVEDQGRGLNEQDQQKLFKKFSRLSTKPTGGEHSTGLGLFIVKKLITALGGEVKCKSQLGYGSTFSVTFPIL